MNRIISSLMLILAVTAAQAKSVSIQFTDNAQQQYAVRQLDVALSASGYEIRKSGDYTLILKVRSELGPEAFAITPKGRTIEVAGGDNRGLIYGALELRDEIRNGTPLDRIRASQDKPQLAFRAIKYNTPWDTYRPSSALDQHYDTARDLKYWEAFLDMMVENRFNTITLWNLHPFTYMVKPKNFPEASPWNDAQQAQWAKLYHGIFQMAKERGLDTYIVFWSIFVSREFAQAHEIATENYYPHYYVKGATSDVVRRYLRESVTQVLQEYPELDGIGVSHGEGMAGMTPAQRQEWVEDVLIAGALEAKRPVKLIHRVPFSSGLGSEPGVSKSVEEVTRAGMESLGDKFNGPIWVEMKFNWSHGHSTPKLVKVHGGRLGDTYFVPKPKNYEVVWQIRNEDFFALRWGVPDFIRQHIALNGHHDYVGGYFIGSETYIPALDYFTAVHEPVDWQWAFQRQWLFYKLWGRLLYDASTPDALFQSDFNRRYGTKGNNLLRAYSLASATQLRLASLYDSTWDFTLYSEGFMGLQGEEMKYIGVDQLINRPTMDPDYVSVADYVRARRAGETFASNRITPPLLADTLERDNREALRLVSDIDTSGNASLMYEVADVRTWANLGLHLAEKLRGAVALQTFRASGDVNDQRAAVDHLQRALEYWDEVIAITRPIYRDMKLTAYNGNSFDANPHNLFHWALIRDEVAWDVEVARGPSGQRKP